MGCLFILNDSEQYIYWRKNFFKIENFIMSESIILIILSLIAYIAYPYDSFSLIRQKINISTLVLYIFAFSLAAFLISILIKKIHLKNKMRPNHRLCLMNFYGRLGFCFVFLCFILSLYISLFMIEWEAITGIIIHRALESSSKKIVISFGKAIFTLIWNEFMLIVSIFGFIDFAMEISIISKAIKYLSINNNINNQKLLNELFRIPIRNNFDINTNNENNENTLYNYNLDSEIKKDKITKLRLVMANNISNEENGFGNNENKFREVEIIQKIEYRSIGIQTDVDIYDGSIYNNINDNTIDNNYKNANEDLSNNFILVKEKSLIDSKTTFNEIINMPIK